eukprot:TRINITY_DN27597_c0_g1_i1.p1 TRINITY_DN27597_c0_g1~~TRINITY_DN27597_c0_g1_i1.p1  ORF type:complete len:794 (+),score=161.71 TRINITY_DN27597_c0_g1_i1:76-2457(+)
MGKSEKQPLVGRTETKAPEIFKAHAMPSLYIWINPLAWILWILDFLIWLVLIIFPCFTLRFCVRRCRSESAEGDDDEGARRRRADLWGDDGFVTSPFINDDDEYSDEATGWEIFETACEEYSDNEFLGTREFIQMHKPEGQRFPLKAFGDTTWQTYNEVYDRVIALGAGLRTLGMQPLPPGTNIETTTGPHTLLIFEETSAEWLTTLYAAFSQSLTVATSYATLGIDAVADALKETGAPVVVCNRKNVEKLSKVAPASLQFIVYTDVCVSEEDRQKEPVCPGGQKAMSLESLIQTGSNRTGDFGVTPPEGSQVGVIMYTSGSTGKPKGVMITHRSLGTAAGSLRDAVAPKPGQETYLAYLPAAHILELAAEVAMTSQGARLGFADPRTLSSKGALRVTDEGEFKSTPGWPYPPGAIQEFCPTVMAAVPIIWDTLKKGAEEAIGQKSCVVQFLFQVAFAAQYLAVKQGRTCPLFNLLVFKNFHSMLGGNLRLAITGGGPISGDVQSFVRTAFGCNLIQGYALTETCACGTVQDPEDPDDGVVGPPVAGVEIKLRSCDGPEDPKDREGNPYLTEDDEHLHGEPCQGRGEVCIRGPAVSVGYFKQPDKTAEVFQPDGWFRTGDIGLWDSRGRLKLVDRLKNLVKLMGGEYIAIESMEKEYATSPFVDSLNGGVLCIGDGTMRKPAALVQVKLAEMKQWARLNDIPCDDCEALCKNKDAIATVLQSLQACGKKGKLGANEIIGSVRLICGTGHPDQQSLTSPWTPENKCRTASNKLERRTIAEVYASMIDEMKKECC